MKRIMLLLLIGTFSFLTVISQNLITDSSFADNVLNKSERQSNYWKEYNCWGLKNCVPAIADCRNTYDKFNSKLISEIYLLNYFMPPDSIRKNDSLFNNSLIKRCNFLALTIQHYDNVDTNRYFDLVGCSLVASMIKDSTYIIQAIVSPYSHSSINTIQVFFSDKEKKKLTEFSMAKPTDLFNLDSSMLYKYYSWDTIRALYKANGGEKYFYIGNIYNTYKKEFYTVSKKKKIVVAKKKKIDPHLHITYLVDDVLIRKTSTEKK